MKLLVKEKNLKAKGLIPEGTDPIEDEKEFEDWAVKVVREGRKGRLKELK